MEIEPKKNTHPEFICTNGDANCDFLNQIISLRKEVELLTEQVRTDALTGLFNFRFFNETVSLEMERTRRGAQPLSMIILDIDHFKKFNDQWGHESGNNALTHIARLIKLAIRKLDFPCRFGGEEFVILLPNTDLKQAVQVAERLREMIASTPVLVSAKQSVTITASLGVDQFAMDMAETDEAFIQRVDTWLYKAKHDGRNCVSHPEISARFQKESVTVEEKNALFNFLSDDSQDTTE